MLRLSMILTILLMSTGIGQWQSLTPDAPFRKPLTPDADILFRIIPSAEKGGTTIAIRNADGQSIQIHLAAVETKLMFEEQAEGSVTDVDGKMVTAEEKGEKTSPELILSDGCFNLTVETSDASGKAVWFPRLPFYVRPNPFYYAATGRGRLYHSADRTMIVEKWNAMPGLSERGAKVRLQRNGGGVRIWVEDRFVAKVPLEGDAEVSVDVPKNAPWEWQESRPLRGTDGEPVPLDGYLDGAQDTKVQVHLLPGEADEVRRVFPEALGERALNIGRSRWLQDAGVGGANEGMSPLYFSRSAFDHMAENIILAVPNQDYRAVRLLCAPLPGKNPALSLRLTHFGENTGDGGGIGDALADQSLVLEKKDGKWPEGCREVGSIRLEDGTEAPLLLVDVPLTTGPIPDLLDADGVRGRRSMQYLDLEITKQLRLVMPPSRGIHAMLPVGAPSGVRVLGVTMERAPRVRLHARRVGNVYLPGEKAGWDLEIANAEKGFRGKLEWTRRTVDGAPVAESRAVEIPADETSGKVPLDFELENGWHGFEFRLLDADGRLVWERGAALAQLAADTRKAGAESPYGTWWFRTIHGGTDDIHQAGPLLQRLGLRKVNPRVGEKVVTEKDLAEYQLRLSMLSSISVLPSRFERRKEQVSEYAARHPNVDWGMIFHETRIQGSVKEFPPEFIGRKITPLTKEQKADLEEKVKMARKVAAITRGFHPDMKLMAGNGTLSFVMTLMQNHFPKDLVDAWGDETTGQSILPETPPSTSMNTMFWLREYAGKYGYDVPVTTAYEWTYRSTKPGDLTPLDQARFYTRDILQALAYGAPHINPAALHDVSDAYYYSRWGAVGLMSRYPVLAPKPSYVAYSVLTRELDQAKYQRNFPTDSPTTNVMEFRHGDEWVYALWIPRGERAVKLEFEGKGDVKQTDMLGRGSVLVPKEGVIKVQLSGSPVYLRASRPLVSVKSGETQIDAPEGKWEIVEAFDDADRWTLAATGDKDFETYQFDHPRELASFQLSSNGDATTRLTLQPNAEKPWPIIRYGILQPKQVVALTGKPEAIGVWVRGNSAWGRVFFELKDAKGRRLVSTGRNIGGWSINDWQGEHFVNFDGWNFIQVQLPGYYDGVYPMPQNGNWKVSEDAPLAYPLKLTGLIVEMREKVVRINDVVDVPNLHLDLKNLSIKQAEE